MAWIFPLLLSLVAGWFLARTLTSNAFAGPRWAALAAEFALAGLFGPGLASIGFFALTLANAASKPAVYAMVAALGFASGVLWWKFREPRTTTPQSAPGVFPWKWALLVAVVVGAGLFLLDFETASGANPNGEWDATAIWNLRARFLAGGPDTWKRAVSAEIGGHMTGAAHPGYPLFLSSFLAMQWVASQNFDVAVPIAASLLFSLGLWMLLVAGLASRRSVTLGALAGLLLICSEVFVSQAASQYSDLLAGFAFLAALLLLEAAAAVTGSPTRLLISAGLAMGFAPWIKNEGLPFILAAFAVVAWKFHGSGLMWSAAGAAPGLAATAALKFISEGRESMFPANIGEALTKIADPSRWWQALLGFGKAIVEAGNPWAHPVLLAVALILVLGFRASAERRAQAWLWIPIAVAVAAEYGLYLVTNADLSWHISTSVSRLLAQVWPSLIWLTLLLLRTPEQHFVAAVGAAPETPVGKKKRAGK